MFEMSKLSVLKGHFVIFLSANNVLWLNSKLCEEDKKTRARK